MATTTTTYEPTTTTIYYDDDPDEFTEPESLIIYPEENYETWIGLHEAEDYFESRLNSSLWERLDDLDREAALLTAFRSLRELFLNLADLDSTDATVSAALLNALKQAQCEQALHELSRDLDGQRASSVSIGGLLSANFPEKVKTDRFSERALAMLRPWLTLPSVKRFR